MSGSDQRRLVTDVSDVSAWYSQRKVQSVVLQNAPKLLTVTIQRDLSWLSSAWRRWWVNCSFNYDVKSVHQAPRGSYTQTPLFYLNCSWDVPVNPGVAAAIFLARTSLSMLGSSLIGRRWTLKMDALPLMSGGPERKQKKSSRSSATWHLKHFYIHQS